MKGLINYHFYTASCIPDYGNSIVNVNAVLGCFFLHSMSQLVHAPAIVRDIDWASHVWPTDLPEDR